MKIPKFEPIQSITEEQAIRPGIATKRMPILDNLQRSSPVKKQLHEKHSLSIRKQWNIEELKEFFNSRQVFPDEIRLDCCTRIVNMPLFLESHLNILEKYNYIESYKPHLLRLQKLRDLLKVYDN